MGTTAPLFPAPFIRFFERSPALIALLRGPEHRVEVANPAFLKLAGHRPVIGRPLAEALPEAVEQGYLALLDQAYASGEAHVAKDAALVLRDSLGQPVERVVDLVFQPVGDADGRVGGILVSGVDVTERVAAEAALGESEARFRAALNAGRMGSWETDHVTKTRTWSREGMQLFGLDLPNGKGRVDGPDDEYVAAIHPDDRHVVQRIRELANRQDSFPAEYRIVRPDGTTIWLAGRGAVVARYPDGRAMRLVSIMADDTDRRLADEQLRIERERLSLALSAGRMGAYDFNLRDGLLWWSPQTYRVFGVSPQDFVPTADSVTALLHPDDREAFLRLRAQALAERRIFEHEFRVVGPDGAQRWIGHRGQADYDDDGRPVRSFGIAMDITQRRHVEDLLRNADRQKDRFIAVLAHELRNPLAPIRNAIDLLRHAGPGSPEAAWCRDVIDRQVRQMTHLLDDLLDVSRLSRGQLQLQVRPLEIGPVLKQAIETAQPVIDAGGHALSVEVAPDTLHVAGDFARLTQIVANVLINAAKYTPQNGRIDVTARAIDHWLVLRIADNGIGIAAESLPVIFEMFGRVESATSRADGGQGIGLSLARILVEMHGGSIAAYSDGLGKGSMLEIRLPLIAAPQPRASTDPLGAGAASAVAPAGRRILVADDQRDIADSYARLLRQRGHLVEIAYDGEAALAMAEAFRPDVFVADLGMPILDGLEVCRRVRAAPWGSAVRMIACSGWGQDQDRRLSAEAGFDHHLLKPVEPDALFQLIEQAV